MISYTQIDLSWTDNSGDETGFKVERKTGASGTYGQVATLGAGVTSYSDGGLSSRTHYYYRVRSYNANCNSAYSNEADAITFFSETKLTAYDGSAGDQFGCSVSVSGDSGTVIVGSHYAITFKILRVQRKK